MQLTAWGLWQATRTGWPSPTWYRRGLPLTTLDLHQTHHGSVRESPQWFTEYSASKYGNPPLTTTYSTPRHQVNRHRPSPTSHLTCKAPRARFGISQSVSSTTKPPSPTPSQP